MEENRKQKTKRQPSAAEAEELKTLYALRRQASYAYNRGFLRQLEIYRKEKGWSYPELAERAEVKLSTIRNWQRKGSLPGMLPIVQLCIALGVMHTKLFNYQLTEEEQAAIQRYEDFRSQRYARKRKKK